MHRKNNALNALIIEALKVQRFSKIEYNIILDILRMILSFYNMPQDLI